MRELMVLRHGKSDWSHAVPDFDRPLKRRGVRAAQRVGAFLVREEVEPDLVLSSPAARAAATAAEVCAALEDEPEVRHAADLYHAPPHLVLEVLRAEGGDARRILVVGHNPGLAEFVEMLADGPMPEPGDGKLMPTAALARFSVADAWSDLSFGGGRLLSLTRPRDLPQS